MFTRMFLVWKLDIWDLKELSLSLELFPSVNAVSPIYSVVVSVHEMFNIE